MRLGRSKGSAKGHRRGAFPRETPPSPQPLAHALLRDVGVEEERREASVEDFPDFPLNRRRFLKAGVLAGLGTLASPFLNFGRCRVFASEPVAVSTRAVDLVVGSTVIDMLGLLTLDWAKLGRWQAQADAFTERDFRQLEVSGVSIFHPAVEPAAANPHQAALTWIGRWNKLVENHGCFLGRIDSITDLLHLPKVGKLGILIGLQNADHFRRVSDVAAFHGLGQRVSQLTYNTTNSLGSGCFEPRDGGLTAFGAKVVGEMNRVGMAVDISHCGERTSLEAIAVSRQPVLVTHSNCKALVPGQPRCKSDQVIRLMAAGGGVMGITTVPSFVSGSRSPTISQLLDHFDHVVRVAGVEHVGLGSDVDVTALDPATGRIHPFYAIRGLDPVGRVFQIADGLLSRGYSEAAVKLVLGGNFQRALTSIFPAQSWQLLPERETRRDPFCPAPYRRSPLPVARG